MLQGKAQGQRPQHLEMGKDHKREMDKSLLTKNRERKSPMVTKNPTATKSLMATKNLMAIRSPLEIRSLLVTKSPLQREMLTREAQKRTSKKKKKQKFL